MPKKKTVRQLKYLIKVKKKKAATLERQLEQASADFLTTRRSYKKACKKKKPRRKKPKRYLGHRKYEE